METQLARACWGVLGRRERCARLGGQFGLELLEHPREESGFVPDAVAGASGGTAVREMAVPDRGDARADAFRILLMQAISRSVVKAGVAGQVDAVLLLRASVQRAQGAMLSKPGDTPVVNEVLARLGGHPPSSRPTPGG